MYWVLLPMLCVIAEAAKLDRAYLPPPPPNAKEAGGRDEDLQPPLEPPYIDPYSDNRHLFSGDGRRGFGRPTQTVQDEDQIRWGIPKSRFLYGSYAYTGPNNVLVTVTYTADKNSERRHCGDDSPRSRFDWSTPYDAEDGVIPTPSSLQRELEKAFAFHRRKYQPEDERNTINRQPWSEQPTQKPIIHQGYSYPKTPAAAAKN